MTTDTQAARAAPATRAAVGAAPWRFHKVAAAAAVLALGLGAHEADALGLGRLSVQSALGESLRAEIDVTSITAEESGSLRLRIAPAEAYRAAGVDYNAVLPNAQLQLVRRPDGRSVLRLTSDRAVLEPFVDVIIEANWASGRLVREYTLLFDPPGARASQQAAAGAATSAAISPAPATASVPLQAPQAAPPMAAAPAPAPRAAVTRPPASDAPAAAEAPMRSAARPPSGSDAAATGGDAYRVRTGDSLSRIARSTQRQGVSLDQMLVSLFRANPQAFVGDNMNRLRAGAVLTVPSADSAGQLGSAEARSVIQAQSADFAAYRQRLAAGATVAADAAPSRQATGRVQAEVDDRRQGAVPAPDKLTLSQGGVRASAPEAGVSRDTERKDSTARLAELSRNVDELKRLQQGTSAPGVPGAPTAAPAAATPGAPTIVAPPPVRVPPPAVVAPAPAPTVIAAAPTPAPAVAVPPPAPPPAPVAAPPPAPAAATPAPVPVPSPTAAPVAAPAPAPTPTPATASDDPGILGSLTDNPLVLPGAALLVLALAGFGMARMRGRRKQAGETSFLESRLQPDSFFGASGGQRIDTREAASTSSGNSSSSSMSYSLSQLDAIGDVDPVAEADVYLAYGRDLQAEEILKEAMRATPDRMSVRTKLLEVYAKRRDAKAFELLATQVYNLTGGEGEDWAKAQALGLTVDPDNALYQAGGRPDEVLGAGGQPVEALGASTVPYTAPAGPPAFVPAADATLDSRLDLDLDVVSPGPAPSPPTRAPAPSSASAFTTPRTTPDAADDGMLDFDLTPTVSERPPAPLPEPERVDFDLGDDSFDLRPAPPAPPTPAQALDFGDFSITGEEVPAAASMDGDPLERKLELAEEFRQIGDTEGARDLLEEVVMKADGALRAKAQGMLDGLG